MVIKLGITGGIGSGKTSVCRVFNILGIPVFLADEEARIVMDSDKSVIAQVNSITGKDMYPDGNLDRAELASLIFNNKDLLQKVNSVVHPVIFENFRNWSNQQESEYVILEAAILFESGASSHVDRIATVIAPIEERIQRVMQRNSLTREQVLERIMNQSSDEEKTKQSHFVINNSDNEMIIPEIIKIHNEMVALTKNYR